MINITYKARPALNYPNTDVHEFTPIPICFVGAPGVGKTSLLASMYKEIKKGEVDSICIDQFNSQEGKETLSQLNVATEAMLEMFEQTEKWQNVQTTGIAKTNESHTYEFIGKHTMPNNYAKLLPGVAQFKEFRFPFHFIDMPGGWYTDDGAHTEEARKVLENSVASFLTIDTPALMESDATNARFNKVMKIESWYCNLKNVLAAAGHAVIFVLSKAEKYWNDFDGLKRKMEACYGTLISSLKNAGVKVYATKIKTLGGIEFLQYKEKRPQFIRTGDYTPENCATPLQLALKHGLIHVVEKMPKGGFLERVGGALGLTNREIAIKSAEALANELNEKLKAGSETNYIEL